MERASILVEGGEAIEAAHLYFPGAQDKRLSGSGRL
jgi:hypothetical protein